MVSITDQMTALYCFVDDYLQSHPRLAGWRRSPNSHPAFTDAEVLTVALLQGCLGVATLKQTYRLVAANWGDAFPHLCSYRQWLARLHQLTPLVGFLIHAALGPLNPTGDLYLLDTKPIPVCRPLRHGRVRLLREDGAYFAKGTAGWFFGFKLHVLAHHTGLVIAALLTPANCNDRDGALALAWSCEGGIALADLGYRSAPLWEELYTQADLVLLTPADAGTDRRLRAQISSLRQQIETTFSQLWHRFADRVFSRSWNGLWNTLKLKLLHFNLCRVGLLPT
jgi:transposase